MNLESVIENNEQKIIFLKAIILGINYGKTDNADIYRNNILNEIKKLNEKININKKILNNSLDNGFRESLLTQKSEEVIKVKQSSILESTEKYDTNILNLEKQKSYTINLINNLTASNYQYNYSKINLLKSNLINIDKEIEKNKINILKHKEKNNFKPNIFKNNQTQENFAKILKTRENIIPKYISKENNMKLEKISKEENIDEHKEEKLENKNLSGELEKTLSSLTNLLS